MVINPKEREAKGRIIGELYQLEELRFMTTNSTYKGQFLLHNLWYISYKF